MELTDFTPTHRLMKCANPKCGGRLIVKIGEEDLKKCDNCKSGVTEIGEDEEYL